jgi:hypothetical protein
MYYSHIHSDKINPLIKEAFNQNKSMHDNGIFTWYTFAKEIFAEFEIDKSDFEAFSRPFKIVKISIKKIFKKSVYVYEKQLTGKLSLNNDSSKLFLYSKLKSDIKLEEYLKSERNFKNRQLLTKFRLSDHNLEIELGRYKNIPRNQRHCKFCKTLDAEFHFFFDCKVTDNIRPSFIDFMKTKYPRFNNHLISELDSLEKLKVILNPDKESLPSVCNFIKRSLEARI